MDSQDASWKAVADAKRAAILTAIPEEWQLAHLPSPQEVPDVTGDFIQQYLTPQKIKITEADAVKITKNTSSGQWTAVEVTEAFCHRAALAHQMTNCLHEVFFSAALEEARLLDEYLARHGKPKGPLHGLPISLKDQFHVRGVETTMGYVSWIGTFQGKPYDGRALNYESELVRELRELGAVLYCKTSVPHTLMGAETSNNIVGYVRLPQNRRLSPGASSGGEGALIGFRGSPAGFGTDIGGSIRHPSALNGLYGLRPSSGRSPYEGAANSMDGQNVMPSVVGPMATSASALKLLMKAVLSQQPWLQDPLVVELPWRTEMEESVLDLIRSSTDGRGKLAFGVLKHDGCVMPQPPVQRAMEYVTGLLKRLGHKVIEWEPPSHKLAAKLAFEIYGLDGGRDCFQNLSLSGESPIPQVLEPFNHGQGKQADASQIAAINIEKREFQKAYLDYWNETINVTGTGRTADALITPVIAYTAVKPHQLRYVDYSLFVNILDYPSVTVPVTRADKAIDKQDQTYRPENSQDQQVYDDYDAELYHGSPIAVQLVGRRLHEEQILTLAEYLSGLLDFH